MTVLSPPPCNPLWSWLCRAAHDGVAQAGPPPEPVTEDEAAFLQRYQPLLACRCYAHLAQSLDGRIALADGSSFWISGEADRRHTHRLRALAHAVLVGAETVLHDDPQLTVRETSGPHPVRVVLDPAGRVPADRRVFAGQGRAILVRGAPGPLVDGAEELVIPEVPFAPERVLEALAGLGLRRVFIEGGGVTVSRFLAAGSLDRLHLVVAPVLLGQGRPSLDLELGATIAACPRPAVQVSQLGEDTLYDLDLS